MEKELFSQFNYSETSEGAGIRTDQTDDIRKQEKALKRDATSFWLVGLMSLMAGGALIGILNSPPLLELLSSLTPWIAGVGIGALGVGVYKLLKKVRLPGLSFDKLKLRRKSMSSSAAHTAGGSKTAERSFEETTYMRKKLAKSNKDRVFFGVAGGLAEFAGISPTLLRLIFIIAAISSFGAVFVVYLAMALLMPVVKNLK